VSKPPEKYIIGLTGNIATGKSVVRRMLEHLGAYSIDADSLGHRAISKGAPGYQPVVNLFGKWILGADGEIDRAKLAELVFRDPQAMEQLEDIVHPLVGQAVDIFIRRASQKVIVIEAIKLLESSLKTSCNTIWVTYAPENIQVERLVRKRSMTRDQALERIHAQSHQSEKIAAAGVVIRNSGSYDDLWKQVSEAWKQISGVIDITPAPREEPGGELKVRRGRPRDTQVIAELITRLSKGKRRMTADHVMEEFGDKAYLMLQSKGKLVGLAGWQVENLVARTTDLYLDINMDAPAALQAIVNEVERASAELQSEASLIFPFPELAANQALWKNLGYEQRTPQTLGVQAWQEAAIESMPEGTALYFKQLRRDRVMRPI
jgi:dephospho-CoA kinase